MTLNALFDLTGRVAIITGGSRGLGFQMAEALGEYGAQLVLVARKQHELDEAVALLAAKGITAMGIALDLSGEGASAELTAQVMAAFGRIDILVNNAGASWGEAAESHSLDGWNKVINLNLTGLFVLTQAVANAAFLPQADGVVLNIASIEGLMGHHWRRPGTAAYNAAKGGVINLTRALAAEWGPKGVRVNAIAPGYFPSKLSAKIIEAHEQDLVENTPLGKLGGDNDMMGAALLLCSAAGGHITGQVLTIDGGFTII
jgi:NAD(P)-dependent dehydrogenase (short-subunit alcohol dehydrogenase family)